MKNDRKVAEAKEEGQHYLSQSQKTVKTEWANQIKKGLEAESSKK
jgi:hypothetical protein